MVYMFWYNSTHDKFHGTVKAQKRKLVINKKALSIFQKQDTTNIKWDDTGALYVVESTDVFITMEKAEAHLKRKPKESVIMSVPSTDDPMIVKGVNQEKYDD